MEVQYIFADQDEAGDAAIKHDLNEVALERHDIVVETVIPFTNQFDHAEAFLIIAEDHFYKECSRPNVIPLRMNVMVIDPLREIHFAILLFKERGVRVVARDVVSSPVVMWFYIVHALANLAVSDFIFVELQLLLEHCRVG